MTKVYVLDVGCYEEAYLEGVYATPEAAMSAHSPSRPSGYAGVKGREYGDRAGQPWSYEWTENAPDPLRSWTFGADWNNAARIDEYEVQS